MRVMPKPSECEEADPMQVDLGRDDIKVVRYRIIFTKPGCEAVLADGEETVIDRHLFNFSF
jgi:hypothetical protein